MTINRESFREQLKLSKSMNSTELSQRQVDRVCRIKEDVLLNSNREDLVRQLKEHLEYLKDWSPHYDFELWSKIESQFECIWPQLRKLLFLGIEYELYEEVRDIFFEIRNLLQWTGLVKERIYFSAWLRREAIKKDDKGTVYLSISSLAWSFTSSGCYQNLDEASLLWKELDSFINTVDDSCHTDSLRNHIIVSLGKDLYSELMMDAYENGVRIAIRNQCIDDAKHHIERGKKKVKSLFLEGLISRRLEERFMIAFQYHEGITFFLQKEYSEAEFLFGKILERASLIGWNRVVSGAQSWLATLAIELKKYDRCEDILADLIQDNLGFPHKRDGICQLIKAQLFDKIGHKDKKAAAEAKAARVFREISGSTNDRVNSCNLSSFVLSPHF